MLLFAETSGTEDVSHALPPQNTNTLFGHIKGKWDATKTLTTNAYSKAMEEIMGRCEPYFPVVPISNRRQINFLSPAQENQIGNEKLHKIKMIWKESGDNGSGLDVKRIGYKLAWAAEQPQYKWEFMLLESQEFNALCAPGGKVVVFNGITDFTANSSELAFVLAHEIAHAIARHYGEAWTHSLIEQGGSKVIDLSLIFAGQNHLVSSEFLSQISMAKDMSIQYSLGLLDLQYSRKQEDEADRMGLLLMAKAGYNPDNAIILWERQTKAHPNKHSWLDIYLRTHPLDETRVKNLKAWFPEAREEYERYMKRNNQGIQF